MATKTKKGWRGTFEQAYAEFKKKKFTDKLNQLIQKREVDDLSALDKLLIIAEVMRQNRKADYDKTTDKWVPWFVKRSSGWVFFDTCCEDTITNASVGPRFALHTDEDCRYFTEEFIDLHIEVLNND